MARNIKLPTCPPSIVIRRSDGACISPEWTAEERHQKLERLVEIYGTQLIDGALAMVEGQRNGQ